MNEEVQQLKSQVLALQDVVNAQQAVIQEIQGKQNKDVFSNKRIFKERVEMPHNVYIKDVADISLTPIGDTSAGNESSNITANFNKIINALNNK